MSESDDFQALLAVIRQIVCESGDPNGFDAAAWLSAWLRKPLPALGNATPLELLDEPGGIERIRTLLLRIQSGAYS